MDPYPWKSRYVACPLCDADSLVVKRKTDFTGYVIKCPVHGEQFRTEDQEMADRRKFNNKKKAIMQSKLDSLNI